MPLTDTVPDINSSDDDPLENHIDTVLDYVRSYHKMTKDGVATVRIGLLHTRVSLKLECRSKLDNVLLVQWGIESYLYRTCSESYIRVFLSIFVSPPG